MLYGCDPKKVLVGGAESVDWTGRMKGKGIQAAKLRIDWPELMRFKRSFTEPVPNGVKTGLRKPASQHSMGGPASPLKLQYE